MVLNPSQDINMILTRADRILEPFETSNLSVKHSNFNKSAEFFIQHSNDKNTNFTDQNDVDKSVEHYGTSCTLHKANSCLEITIAGKEQHMTSVEIIRDDQSSVSTRKRSYALGSCELTDKRNTICALESSYENLNGEPKTQSYGYLSKSWNNLKSLPDENVNHYSKARRKMSSFFTLRSSNSSMNVSTDGDSLGITKSRTPSLFRKFSKVADSRRSSGPDIQIPIVNIISDDCQDTLKDKSRNFSLRGSTKNLSTLPDIVLKQQEETTGLKVTNQKTFSGLRSPFSRPKFDKNNADMRKKVYDEMLVSIQDGNCKRLKLLLKRRRTDMNTTEHNLSLIHEAAFKGCVKCIKALIKSGWSVDFSDDSGWRPLHAACFGGSVEAVNILLHYGANPNCLTSEGVTPLHLTVFNDDLYSTHTLMRNGGDALVQSHFSETPFQLAINLKKKLVLEYMMLQSCFLVDEPCS